ncbi:MAG: M60 family metallopeptidase [Anaeroplasmataceae bacterium]|nr:M60 family metallopeptidase [Anaeroplasmataceae bacterium]
MKRKKKILTILTFVLVVLFAFSVASCRKNDVPNEDNPTNDNDNNKPGNDNNNPTGPTMPTDPSGTQSVKNGNATEITGGYEKGTARATQTSEYLGAVDKIVKPVKEVMDEHETYGVKVYPTYGKNLKGFTVEERDGLIKEAHALAPSPSWKSLGIYNAIDSEGYLLKNGQRILYGSGEGSEDNNEEAEGEIISGGQDAGLGEGSDLEEGSTTVNSQYNLKYRMLYKHTAALTHFGGGLSDDEPRIVKKITALTHPKLESTTITGLYAPAGEVIKFEMSLSDYLAAGGLRVLIGQNYNLSQHVSMETSGNGIKGNGLNRMPDILSIFQYNDKTGAVYKDGDTVTFYVGSFLGGPIYFRPIKNTTELKISVTISGAVKYQHFILGVTTPEEYEFNKASTAPYFDLEVYDSVRFTTHKYASSNGLALKDFTYENCSDAAVLWDKIAEVSTRVRWNGLSGASAPVYIIGDCYIAAGAAFANPGRNGVVCPPSWLAEALNYNRFVNSGSWGTMHEYNHCWQGYGLKNSGEVGNNAVTLVSYSLYTRISQSRTAATNWGNGSWNRFTDPSKALGELLSLGANGSIREDLSVYATLIHNIGQDMFVAAAKGGKDSGSIVYFNNLVNATHMDMTYYFTDVLHLGVNSSRGINQATVDAVKEKNYPMFVPVSSLYQVGRSIIYDGNKQYITTAQPYSYGTGEFTMDFTNKNNFASGAWKTKALVIPDGFTVTVKNVTQPANGTVEYLGDNKVKYTPKSGENGLYSGNFIVTLGITKDNGDFVVEDVDLVINLKQGVSTDLNRTTYTYADAANVVASNAVYNAQTKAFDFGNYVTSETRRNICTQETNTQIWGAGRTYLGDTYDENKYQDLEVGKTIQTLDGVLYFSSPNTYRFTLKGRGKGTLYLSYDAGATWEKAFTFDRKSGSAYVNDEYYERELTASNTYIYFKVVLQVTYDWKDFFGIGIAAKQADGNFAAFSNASAISLSSVGVHAATLQANSKKFETEYHFESNYSYAYSATEKVPASMTKLVSVNRGSWDDKLTIENLFDGNANTFYHSIGGTDNFITEEKPFELVVDLGAEYKVNSVTFNGYSGKVGNNGMVKSFKIYGSTDGNNYTLITEQTDSAANKKVMTFSFDEVNIRYYKLVVTKTDNGRYFAMNSIEFASSVSFEKGNMVTPHDSNVLYSGEWGTKNILCDYGIIYTAEAGSSVEYHFTGTRVAYFADMNTEYGTVDIYIDGKLIASDVSLSGINNDNIQITQALYNSFNEANVKMAGFLAYIYSGDALSNGEHVLKIVGKTGSFNVDAFAYWS